MIGAAILSLYGIVTALGGILTLCKRGIVNIPRIQAAVFALIGIAVMVAAVLSISRSVGLLWLVVVSLASLLSRVWNGFAMGRVHPSHVIFFGSVFVVGIVLTAT